TVTLYPTIREDYVSWRGEGGHPLEVSAEVATMELEHVWMRVNRNPSKEAKVRSCNPAVVGGNTYCIDNVDISIELVNANIVQEDMGKLVELKAHANALVPVYPPQPEARQRHEHVDTAMCAT